MTGRTRFLILFLGVIGLAALCYEPLERRVASARLLSAMKDEDHTVPPQPGRPLNDIITEDGRSIPARIYGPDPESARLTIVLAHGIHYKGIEEPRLIRFAEHLARTGCRVVTPLLGELADYQITNDGVTVIRDTVRYAAQPGEPVGLIGFSFAGGLAMLAAEDPDTAQKLRYAASIGGYHDLNRALRFLATDEVMTRSGPVQRKAHEYGLLVLLYGNLEPFQLGSDESILRSALKAWLQEDRKQAAVAASRLTGEKAKLIFGLLKEQNLRKLAPDILPLIERKKNSLEALSPRGRLGDLKTNLIFLHGAGDNVVPPEETLFAAQELARRSSLTWSDYALVTPLLQHVRVEHEAGMKEQIELVNLVAQLL